MQLSRNFVVWCRRSATQVPLLTAIFASREEKDGWTVHELRVRCYLVTRNTSLQFWRRARVELGWLVHNTHNPNPGCSVPQSSRMFALIRDQSASDQHISKLTRSLQQFPGFTITRFARLPECSRSRHQTATMDIYTELSFYNPDPIFIRKQIRSQSTDQLSDQPS
jgi:hypothetical protein